MWWELFAASKKAKSSTILFLSVGFRVTPCSSEVGGVPFTVAFDLSRRCRVDACYDREVHATFYLVCSSSREMKTFLNPKKLILEENIMAWVFNENHARKMFCFRRIWVKDPPSFRNHSSRKGIPLS